jgi:predicted transposase YbfD/YdcC
LCAAACGADGWVGVALFGEQNLNFLRRFPPFANGAPFLRPGRQQRHDPHGFGLERAAQAGHGRWPRGARTTDEKSSEITTIPERLDLLAIKGADCVFGLKGNQGAPRADVELLFTEKYIFCVKDVTVTRGAGTEAGHGPVETREIDDIGWFRARHDRAGLKSIVMLIPIRETAKGAKRERRFYISSLPACAEKLAAAIRAHWRVGRMHRVPDVNFRDDGCRIRKKTPPPTSHPSSVPP